MKKTFKKVVASVMAVASLASVVVGMSASAATGYTSNLSGGTGSLSVSDGFVYASTTSSKAQYLYVGITRTTPEGNTDSDGGKGRTSASATVYGDYSHAWSFHQTETGSDTLSVGR